MDVKKQKKKTQLNEMRSGHRKQIGGWTEKKKFPKYPLPRPAPGGPLAKAWGDRRITARSQRLKSGDFCMPALVVLGSDLVSRVVLPYSSIGHSII